MKTNRRRVVGVAGLVAAMLGGCVGAPREPSQGAMSERGSVLATVATGDASYERVFDAAREVLGRHRFALNRVDAARGVITTYPKRTAGLGSPWDREQSSFGQEWEDLVNQQQRVVRVGFERDEQGGLVRTTVEVDLLRTHRPYWRVEPESVRLSTHAGARNLQGGREAASFEEVIGLDTALAGRLAQAIERRLGDE